MNKIFSIISQRIYVNSNQQRRLLFPWYYVSSCEPLPQTIIFEIAGAKEKFHRILKVLYFSMVPKTWSSSHGPQGIQYGWRKETISVKYKNPTIFITRVENISYILTFNTLCTFYDVIKWSPKTCFNPYKLDNLQYRWFTQSERNYNQKKEKSVIIS